MINLIAELVLFLNLTGLASFVSVGLGVSFGALNSVLMLLLLAYLCANFRSAGRLLRIKEVLPWVAFGLVWPTLALSYSADPELSFIGRQLYLVVLMVTSGVWLAKVGIDRARRLFLIAFVTGFLGLLLSLVLPDAFYAVAQEANARGEYRGRAFGFFLQPNTLTINMGFIAALLLAISSGHNKVTRLSVSSLLVVSAILSGSRAGLIIVAAILAHYWIYLAPAIDSGSAQRRLFTNLLPAAVAILVAVIAGGWFAYSLAGTQNYDLVERLDSLQELDASAVFAFETVDNRLGVISEFVGKISLRPVFGYGTSSMQADRLAGGISIASHNEFLKVAYELGLPALALYCYLLVQLWLGGRRSGAHAEWRFDPGKSVVLVVVLASAVDNGVLASRVLFVVLGCVFAVRYSAQLAGRATGDSKSRVARLWKKESSEGVQKIFS